MITKEKTIWFERRWENVVRENDFRLESERDFARIVHCPSFRRLQGKTQVLGLGDSDFYRTRLTHSMEVAQVCAAISDQIKRNFYEKGISFLEDTPSNYIKPFRNLLNTQLSSAIGLAHDLGHPPFGHGGEVALNYCMYKYGGFEGNGQTLRILSRLEKYVDGYGLNPTRRLLLGILKYPISYNQACKFLKLEKRYKDNESNIFPWLIKKDNYKPPKCYLDTEEDIVQWILKPFPINDIEEFTNVHIKNNKILYNHSFDSSLMEIADDICYSVHDLEDSISLKIITKRNFIKSFKEEVNDMTSFINDLDKNIKIISKKKDKLDSIAKTLFVDIFSDFAYKRKEATGRLIHLFIANTKIKYNKKFTDPLLCLNVYLKQQFEKLQKVLMSIITKNVIKSPNVQQLEFKGQRIIIELFKTLENDPERFLPYNTFQKYNKSLNNNTLLAKRVLCDYIAGMTDEYAAKLYERMFCPHKGSVFDRL